MLLVPRGKFLGS